MSSFFVVGYGIIVNGFIYLTVALDETFTKNWQFDDSWRCLQITYLL